MSDEKDLNNNGRPDPDALYGDEECSDVHRVRLQFVQMDEDRETVSPAIKKTVQDFIEQRVALQNVYGIRKDMRNSFRNFAERTRWLAGLLGAEHIPEISAQAISEEENGRKLLKMRKLALKEKDTHPSELLEEASRDELSKEPKIRNAEEYAKYIAGKNIVLLEKRDYKQWRNVMLGFRHRFKSQAERDAFYGVIKMEAEKALREAFIDLDGTITDAFMYLGSIELFEVEDLLDVPKKVFEDAQIQGVFIEFMAKLCGEHPELFFKVRAHLMKLGFFKDPEEIDWHPVIVEAVNKALERAVNLDQAVLERYETLFSQNEFSRQSSSAEKSKINDTLFKRLRQAARVSPGKYQSLRRQFELLEVMDAETADSDDEVRWALLGHLQRWKDIHPWALSKLQLYWRSNKLNIMDELSLEDFSGHENPKFHGDPREGVLIPYGIIPKDLGTEAVAQCALNYFVHEKERYEEFDEEIAKLSLDYREVDSGKLREMYMKFPQYDEKNGGKGYLAERISKK